MKRASSTGGGGGEVLVDLREVNSVGGILSGLGANGMSVGQGGGPFPDAGVARYWNVGYAGGAGGFTAVSQTRRGNVNRYQSPNNGPVGSAAPLWGFPFWRDVTQFPETYRPLRRFTLSGCAQRFGNPDNDNTARFGICRQAGQLTSGGGGGGMSGVEVVSNPLVNGGRWTPRYILAPLGAIVYGTDSGIAGTNPVRIDIEYNEQGPSISVRINRIVCLLLTGLANMPVFSATFPANITSSAQQMFASCGVGGPLSVAVANQFDEFWDFRYRVVEMNSGE